MSAKKENGKITSITISSEKGGKAILKLPFEQFKTVQKDRLKNFKSDGGFVELFFDKNGSITLKPE